MTIRQPKLVVVGTSTHLAYPVVTNLSGADAGNIYTV